MNLIAALQAGIPDAANGYAELYRRGTGTRATWYASFEGDGANSSGANITLDANGKAEVYVDELVDLLVKDASGNTVASFTEGRSSPIEEVRSQSFTGADYVTAASAAGNPTTLQAVLDLWKTNSGAPDWKVLLDGANTKLLDAISRVAGPPFYNVKSTTYGAVGNGTTDDTTAIQAAINAAESAGGGIVWFPRGSYKLTAALSMNGTVSLWGVPPGGSTGGSRLIQSDGASMVLLITSIGSTDGPQVIHGLHFEHSAAATAELVGCGSGSAHFSECDFGSSNEGAVPCNATGAATFTRCTFRMSTSSNNTYRAISSTSGGGVTLLIVRDCWFIAPAAAWGATDFVIASTAKNTLIEGCVFDMSAVTSGTARAIEVGSTGQLVALSNTIRDPSAGTAYMFGLGTLTEGVRFYEDFNRTDQAGGSAALYTITGVTGNATPNWNNFHLGSRERRSFYISDNSASLQLNALEYGFIILERTNGTVQTLTTNFVLPNGTFTLVVKNATGGAGGNITQDAASFRPARTFSIATNNNYDVSRFRGVDGTATVRWFSDSTPQNNI